MARIVLEVLERRHDRGSFDCGNEELNEYLRRLARQHQERGFSRTWVAVEEGGSAVAGFISLAMGHVAFENADPEVIRSLPKHPMPVLHVGRLATSRAYQGRGIGSLLLAHAADLAIAASASVGVYALELVATDQAAYDYYLRRGFLPLKGEDRRLYAPIATLRAARRPLG